MTDPRPSPIRAPQIYQVGQVICRIVTTTVFDLKVYGVEHVPKTGGTLLLSNHQSYLDPVLVGVRIPRPLSFLAKSELFRNPALRWLITNLNAYPVNLGAGDIHAVRETIGRLKEGHLLTIFPEGSRTVTGELAALQPGFALVVRKAGVPIVPAAIDGAYEALPPKSMMLRPYPIRVKFGAPIDVKGMQHAEIVKVVEQRIRGLIADLRAGRAKESG